MAPELDEEFDPGTLHALRAKVLVHACRAGLSESRAMDVVLAVHELAANAIRHGAGAGRLRVWNLVRELCCQVDDGDPPRFEDSARRPADSATGAADTHSRTLMSSISSAPGHGLWLMRQLADRMSMVSGPDGTCVRSLSTCPEHHRPTAADGLSMLLMRFPSRSARYPARACRGNVPRSRWAVIARAAFGEQFLKVRRRGTARPE